MCLEWQYIAQPSLTFVLFNAESLLKIGPAAVSGCPKYMGVAKWSLRQQAESGPSYCQWEFSYSVKLSGAFLIGLEPQVEGHRYFHASGHLTVAGEGGLGQKQEKMGRGYLVLVGTIQGLGPPR